jgi:hypothetical protein
MEYNRNLLGGNWSRIASCWVYPLLLDPSSVMKLNCDGTMSSHAHVLHEEVY